MRRIERRQFLRVGAIGAGLTLADYLRLRGEETPASSKRSAIFVFMEGAPSHQDTFDLKPNAPLEVRGEFAAVDTNAAGVKICEHLPQLALRADKFAVLRGITHNIADHGLAKKYLLTGNKASQTISYPEYGSVVSHQFPCGLLKAAVAPALSSKQFVDRRAVADQCDRTPYVGLKFHFRANADVGVERRGKLIGCVTDAGPLRSRLVCSPTTCPPRTSPPAITAHIARPNGLARRLG